MEEHKPLTEDELRHYEQIFRAVWTEEDRLVVRLIEEVRRLRGVIHQTADVGVRLAGEAEAYRQALTLIAGGSSNPEGVARVALQLPDTLPSPRTPPGDSVEG